MLYVVGKIFLWRVCFVIVYSIHWNCPWKYEPIFSHRVQKKIPILFKQKWRCLRQHCAIIHTTTHISIKYDTSNSNYWLEHCTIHHYIFAVGVIIQVQCTSWCVILASKGLMSSWSNVIVKVDINVVPPPYGTYLLIITLNASFISFIYVFYLGPVEVIHLWKLYHWTNFKWYLCTYKIMSTLK